MTSIPPPTSLPPLTGQPDSFVVEAAAVAPITGNAYGPAAKESWLEYQHPLYRRLLPRWLMVKDFYTSEVADQDCARNYLIRRFQGEATKAFDERVKTSDYTPHLATLIDSLAGMLFAVEDRATRVWQTEDKPSALGDPNDVTSTAHRLWYDADGKGSGLQTLMRQFTIDVIVYQYMWVLVDTTVDGSHVIKLLDPIAVPNWIDSPNGPTEVLTMEVSDNRTSLQENAAAPSKRFLRWTLQGWERWELQRGTQGAVAVKINEGKYKYQDREGRPALPIVRIELPMRRYVAWLLTKKAAVLFNQESVRDFALRIAGFAKFIAGMATTDQLKDIKDSFKRGDSIIGEDAEARGAHRFLAPSYEPAKAMTEILKEKRDEFWHSGFKMYGDAAQARMKTATQITHDIASGVGAFLTLLRAAVDDAENAALYRLEQAERAESPELWGQAHVERTNDFASVDLAVILDQQKGRYFGTGPDAAMPLGRSALVSLSKESARYDGLSVVEGEAEAAVDAYLMGKAVPLLETLGVMPPVVKARLTLKLVGALGIINPEEEVQMSDGSSQKLLDVLLQEATASAESAAAAAQLQAQALPRPGGF